MHVVDACTACQRILGCRRGQPVAFGHPHNDPVRVVLALAGASSARHLQLVAGIANIFNDSDAVARLAAATTPDEVREILGVAA